MKSRSAHERHFKSSGYYSKMRELLHQAYRGKKGHADAAVERVLRTIATHVGDYAYLQENTAIWSSDALKTRSALKKLASSMLQLAKKIEKARPSIPLLVGQSPPYPNSPPIKFETDPDFAPTARIEIADLHSVQQLIEFYGNAWKRIAAQKAGRPSIDAERFLISVLMKEWHAVTGKEPNTSKKTADRQGQITFRKFAILLQSYLNSFLKSNLLTDVNLDTAIKAAVKLRKE